LCCGGLWGVFWWFVSGVDAGFFLVVVIVVVFGGYECFSKLSTVALVGGSVGV